MSEIENEILELCHILFQNLGYSDANLLEISSLEMLFDESIYIEIFKLMFPVLKSDFESIEDSNIDSSEKIQMLIDILANDILKIDLNHIEGTLIAEGNMKHILHFVQLLAEVSNLCKMRSDDEFDSDQNENEEEEIEEENKFEFDGKYYDQPNREGKIKEEELLAPPPPKEDYPSKEFKNFLENNQRDLHSENENENLNIEEDVSKISEVSKSKEVSDVGKKSKDKRSSGRNKKSSKASKRKNGDSAKMNEIDNIYKKIKEDLEAAPGEEIEIYDEDPIEYNLLHQSFSSSENCKGNKKSKTKNRKPLKESNPDEILKQKKSMKKNIERNIFSAKTYQPRYLTQNPSNKLPQKANKDFHKGVDNVSFLKDGTQKMQSIKKNLGLQMEAKQEVENIYEILCENVEKIKENLDGMRNYNLNDDDFETMERLIRQRNEYKSMLKEYIKFNKLQGNSNEKEIEIRNSVWKMKNAQIFEGKLQEDISNEQKSHFYKLRDEKIKYFRKLHRTIFELEKKKIIEEKKEFQELRELRNKETRSLMESVENAYRNKKDYLRNRLEEKKNERKFALLEERKTISELQRKLKSEKANQMEILKAMWKSEKEKFDMLVDDDFEMKKRIEKIYKRY